MSPKISLAVCRGVVLVAGVLAAGLAAAQGPSSSPLADQLKEQYKLAKLVPESNGYRVAEPGTMLVVQKEGIFGVPLGSNSGDRVIYAIQKDTDLHPYNSGASNWKFGVGHKVYLSKINIDAKRENVLFTIVECDCGDPAKPAYYKSIVDFEFPPGYLAAAELVQVLDVINQVLPIDKSPERGFKGGEGDHRNDDLIKMVQAKLPDLVIIAKIRSSNSEFDTAPDALINLKRAGASDAVLEAVTAGSGADSHPPVETQPPNPAPTGCGENASCQSGGDQAAVSGCSDYDSCVRSGTTSLAGGLSDQSLARFQKASQLDPSKGDAWAGMGNAYLQMGQYDEAVAMWDKALQLGATLSIFVCHAKAACGDTGDFLLSTKEISFVNKKGEKELVATPSAVTSEVGTPRVWLGDGRTAAYYFQLRSSGKNYRFYYSPKSPQCNSNFLCSEPGLSQQKVFADYVHGALVRMAAGDLGSRPSEP
jgi:tetratricopeptide (TPR) repeat protein